MAVEARRACGFRKVGGLYLVGEKGGMPCCKMPIILTVCPTCGQGIKQSRGWQWIDPEPWVAGACTMPPGQYERTFCPLNDPERLGDRVGLLWIGAQFYPTPASFIHEGETMGISRRIKTVPRGFKVGETWVFFAHPHVERVDVPHDDGTIETQWKGGIFRIFRPTAIELIVTQTQSENADFMADLEKRHLTPVVVPDNDKDHQGTVYDDEEPSLPLGEPAGAVAHT